MECSNPSFNQRAHRKNAKGTELKPLIVLDSVRVVWNSFRMNDLFVERWASLPQVQPCFRNSWYFYFRNAVLYWPFKRIAAVFPHSLSFRKQEKKEYYLTTYEAVCSISSISYLKTDIFFPKGKSI